MREKQPKHLLTAQERLQVDKCLSLLSLAAGHVNQAGAELINIRGYANERQRLAKVQAQIRQQWYAVRGALLRLSPPNNGTAPQS